jgi:hypothetical protein
LNLISSFLIIINFFFIKFLNINLIYFIPTLNWNFFFAASIFLNLTFVNFNFFLIISLFVFFFDNFLMLFVYFINLNINFIYTAHWVVLNFFTYTILSSSAAIIFWNFDSKASLTFFLNWISNFFLLVFDSFFFDGSRNYIYQNHYLTGWTCNLLIKPTLVFSFLFLSGTNQFSTLLNTNFFFFLNGFLIETIFTNWLITFVSLLLLVITLNSRKSTSFKFFF